MWKITNIEDMNIVMKMLKFLLKTIRTGDVKGSCDIKKDFYEEYGINGVYELLRAIKKEGLINLLN